MNAVAAPVVHGADAFAPDVPAVVARGRTFHTLDALRGVAALIVLAFHGGFFFGMAPPAEGYLAVDLFFAMSGFVIAHRYEADLARGLGLGGFVAVRLRRLYPLFLLGSLLGLMPSLIELASGHLDNLHRATFAAVLPALLMLPSHAVAFARLDLYPLNFVSWSLALELFVNVAWAASYRVWSVRNLVGLLVVSALALVATVAVYGSLDVGFLWTHAPGGLPRAIFGFAAGVLLYKLRGMRLAGPRVPWWTLVLLVPALLFLDPTKIGFALAQPIFDLAFVLLVVPAIVAAAIESEPPAAACGVCALAGLYSYVLYSLHVGFIGLFLRFEERLHFDITTMSPARSVAFAVGLAALCWVAHVGYDKPLRRWLSHLRPPLRQRALQAAAEK